MDSQTKEQIEEFVPIDDVKEESLESDITLESESKDFDILEESFDESEIGKTSDCIEPKFFKKIKTQIEKDLSDMRNVVEDLNNLREETAKLEADLMMKFHSSTWENVSEFIGMSSTTMMQDCMKILDFEDDDQAKCSAL